MPVCIIQFIKGTWKYGELFSAKRFDDLLEFHVEGEGFTWKSKDIDRDRQAARQGWELAKAKIEEGFHHLVILDEFTYVLNYGMVDEGEVIASLRQKPKGLHVLVTGRNAPAALVDIADLVTDMREMKHPFKSGVRPREVWNSEERHLFGIGAAPGVSSSCKATGRNAIAADPGGTYT